jgi:Glu-tRNA(Gln) amidotransferase subunit E-like FAD-binding protein
MIDFYLKKDLAEEMIFDENVKNLEKLCKKALENEEIVNLHSPEIYTEPKTVYELSAIIAEDMVKKYNEKNIITR